MRFIVIILIFSLLAVATHAQDIQPRIVGQKELSTEEGKPITIQLTDLQVEETPVENDSGGNNGGGGGEEDDDGSDGDDNGDNDSDDNGGDDDGSGDNDGDGDDDEGGQDGGNKDDDDDHPGNHDDDDDGDKGDKDNEGSKGDSDDKGNKDNKGSKGDKGGKKDEDDKGVKDKKNDKGKKDGKGKGKGGNARASYPDGYTLIILDGDNYTFTGSSISPVAGFTGVLDVPIRVRNEKYASPIYTLKVTVVPSPVKPNQPPVIIGQSSLTTPMETPLILNLSHLQVSDPDDQYPEGFTFSLQAGENYDVNGLTIIPAGGFSGTLTVPATVNDGESTSAVFHIKITVTRSTLANIPPQITGQLPLSVSANQPVKIVLSQLLVTDPDNEYPVDFTVKVFPGTNYTLDGTTVIPRRDFTGDLIVNVSVSDGGADSEIFPLKITVTSGVNVKPVITGQTGLKIPQGERLEIKLSHLAVEDPDNRFPEDFTLIVSGGDHYAVSNNTVTPDQTFLGTLTVRVSVSDGKTASDPFDVKIQIVPRDKLEIVGQQAISIPEDSSVIVTAEDLFVNDPSNRYPEGFKIELQPGEHYQAKGNRIVPARDYSGNLTVSVTIAQGTVRSAPFQLLIVVEPVNDAPELINVPSDPVVINGRGTWTLFPGVDIIDVDDEYMLFAEIGFRDRAFSPGREKIGFTPVANLHIVFDESTGVLYAVGRGSLTDYRDLIQSLSYDFIGSPDSLASLPQSIYVKLNDGKSTSIEHERILQFDNGAELEIPTAFTPNNDNANDTWEITPLQQGEQINTFIRVYDKNGNIVFESTNLHPAWDGHFNGSPLPADVYFYTIEMDLSYRKISYKGIVSILR